MKYKNLVITQNAKLFQSIRPILICADLDVSQVTTYQKALELLSCFHYVLVVADLSFPDIDGKEGILCLHEEIISSPIWTRIPGVGIQQNGIFIRCFRGF